MKLTEAMKLLGAEPLAREEAELPLGPGRLNPESLAAAMTAGKLESAAATELLEWAGKFAARPELCAYFNYLSEKLFTEKLHPESIEGILPSEIKALSEAESYAFYALLAFSGYGAVRHAFAYASLPPDALAGAFRDPAIWVEHFRRNRKLTGISRRSIGWEANVLNGDPLTIGRMQYRLAAFYGKIQVYRRRADGSVVAFASPGIRCNRAGFIDGVDDEFDPVAWETQFEITPQVIRGNRIVPEGHILRKVESIPAAEYIPVLREGDLALETHIPEGGGLTCGDCKESMNRALEFFRARYPEKTIRGFSCFSWMLDPQYEFLLKPDSRLLCFMRQYYLFPIDASGKDALWRIFGEDGLKNGIANAPRQTSMQRNVADFIARGGRLRSGGGFLLIDEIPRYGEAPYRKKNGKK